jgi:hypothetical protein
MRGLAARVARAERLLRARGGGGEAEPALLVLFPEPGDEPVLAAGGAAAAELIARRTGQRPGPHTVVVSFVERPDGPQ